MKTELEILEEVLEPILGNIDAITINSALGKNIIANVCKKYHLQYSNPKPNIVPENQVDLEDMIKDVEEKGK